MEDDTEEDDDEDDYDEYSGETNVLGAISDALGDLEAEQALDAGVLTSNFKILNCDAEFEEEEEPRTVATHTRIYSPTCPTYVDVHFQYHCRSRYNSIEWHYKLGYKVYKRASKENDYHPSALARFERGSFDGAYSSGGWNAIAYGFYDDDLGGYGSRWKRAEQSDFKLDYEGIRDVYEALWGPLDDLPGDADEEQKLDRRRDLVDTVRILLGAVGIKYSIACEEGESDDSGRMWTLEGLSDRWFARETRKACGFQLKDDPEKAQKGREERAEQLRPRRSRRDDDDEGFDSEDRNSDDDEEDYW
ncbi:hypothetical protein CPB83DRAFT_901803 [Crepidotus variabilis]|uniref:Uncharacterized protein n=1 Tax=Crepidotus variabilis TaxID=179855 RepID=A0A9P6ETB1_9AGAR|nr:hypothetical protein CPB83DRAFT_901803 [Crepidotus variabilis]